MSIETMTNVTPVTVTRPTVSADAAQTITHAIVYQGRCRLQPLSAAEIKDQGRELGTITARAYFAGIVDMRSDDLLPVTESGDEYQVRGVRDVDLLARLTIVELGRETGAS